MIKIQVSGPDVISSLCTLKTSDGNWAWASPICGPWDGLAIVFKNALPPAHALLGIRYSARPNFQIILEQP